MVDDKRAPRQDVPSYHLAQLTIYGEKRLAVPTRFMRFLWLVVATLYLSRDIMSILFISPMRYLEECINV